MMKPENAVFGVAFALMIVGFVFVPFWAFDPFSAGVQWAKTISGGCFTVAAVWLLIGVTVTAITDFWDGG